MKKTPYFFTIMLFVICLGLDLLAFVFNQPLAGITLVTSSVIVFFAAHVWFVHFPETRLRLKTIYLLVPLALIGLLFFKAIGGFQSSKEMMGETLLSQGQLLMSRLQGGLWILGMIMISAFIVAASLLEKKRQ